MNDVTGFFSSVLVTLVTLLPIINPVSTAISFTWYQRTSELKKILIAKLFWHVFI